MKTIPVNTPLLNGNEKKYLNECIDTGWISSDGPFVKILEKEFKTVARSRIRGKERGKQEYAGDAGY